MTFEDDFLEEQKAEEERRKKEGKGKAEGAGAMGQGKAPASEAAFALMKKFGLPQSKVAEILRVWSHLVGDQLVKRITEFAREGVARASAHLHVQFDLKGGFAVVTDFLSSLSERSFFGLKASSDQTPRPH
jgi:hypothetical protein